MFRNKVQMVSFIFIGMILFKIVVLLMFLHTPLGEASNFEIFLINRYQKYPIFYIIFDILFLVLYIVWGIMRKMKWYYAIVGFSYLSYKSP